MFKKVAGTRDILPQEVSRWQKIEESSHHLFATYHYREIRLPLIEEAALFNRSLGEFSEVVQKQMFLIRNKDETYVLRPEATASIVRSCIENNLDKTGGLLKVYYLGPMFRLERPQKGRLRQFHHIGCEAIGSLSADLDVEIISLAEHLLTSWDIEGYQIKINSLGCDNDKRTLAKILKENLGNVLEDLCQECHARFNYNVLRILDCKNETCRQIIKGLKICDQHLCPECRLHFKQVQAGLDNLDVKYTASPHLVRGLDYYTRTVFEITHPRLGAQDALGAGGRYDNLVGLLGGPETGAIGFAFGVERLLLVTRALTSGTPTKNLVYLIAMGEAAKKQAAKILADLRTHNIPADTDYEGRSLKGAMRLANDVGARYCLLLGEDELNKGVVTLKDMASGDQKEVKVEGLIKELMTNVKIQMTK